MSVLLLPQLLGLIEGIGIAALLFSFLDHRWTQQRVTRRRREAAADLFVWFAEQATMKAEIKASFDACHEILDRMVSTVDSIPDLVPDPYVHWCGPACTHTLIDDCVTAQAHDD